MSSPQLVVLTSVQGSSWTLLAIPEIANEEATCLNQSRHEKEKQSREGQLTGQRHKLLKETIPQPCISSVDVILETQQDPLESQRQSEVEATKQQKQTRCPRKKSLSTAVQKRLR